jgi:DNA-binding NtrC family response regulator
MAVLAPPRKQNLVKVLIIDDDEEIIKNIQILMMTKKVVCHTTVSGVIERVKSEDPHIILLDYNLKDGDAFDVLEQIQPFVKRSIPIIFTGMHLPQALQTQLYLQGVMNIIYKPCTLSTLDAIVDNYYEVALKFRS